MRIFGKIFVKDFFSKGAINWKEIGMSVKFFGDALHNFTFYQLDKIQLI